MKKPERIVIWPTSLDSSCSRSEGRKISKSLSVPEPKIQEIEAAAKNLSLHPEVVPDRARPRTCRQKIGYVVAEKKDETRATVLKSIAKEIAKQRK